MPGDMLVSRAGRFIEAWLPAGASPETGRIPVFGNGRFLGIIITLRKIRGLGACLVSRVWGSGELPRHVAIIMDGNGRYAQNLGKSRLYGHKMGVRRLWDILEATLEAGIPYLSVFAFSTENWQRPTKEVKGLFRIARSTVRVYTPKIQSLGVRFLCIGNKRTLNPKDLQAIERLESDTSNNQKLTLAVALDYGGRWEILEAARKAAEFAAKGELLPEALTEERFGSMLQSAVIPDPDLLIRTGGECRLSNFMLWQAAYSELYFSKELWPAFTKEHYSRALEDYVRRERRFGRVSKRPLSFA